MAKVCAIVGMGRGIGLSVARCFGLQGYKLALLARSEKNLLDYSGALEFDGLKALPLTADVTRPFTVISAIREAEKQLGPIEVMVYNAFASRPTKPSELKAEDLEATLRINLYGALSTAQVVLPAMLQRKRGTLLFTGGGLALRPSSAAAALSIGKASLRALVGTLAQELAPEGIHVATVTVAGAVKRGTAFDPDRIAEKFWELHAQAAGQWQVELVFDGK
ncbi:MAG: SDR family NAD(P)-dependent oxidoreductase [Thermaceae bacterium]|nr:SDR family NAD(P)-dependent oxidoreductase [Thermaceae bacterium]